jgi:hypothetical protein
MGSLGAFLSWGRDRAAGGHCMVRLEVTLAREWTGLSSEREETAMPAFKNLQDYEAWKASYVGKGGTCSAAPVPQSGSSRSMIR